MSGVRTSQSDASSDMDLARAPRRTAHKKGSYKQPHIQQIVHAASDPLGVLLIQPRSQAFS
jgi:hypothetical protein